MTGAVPHGQRLRARRLDGDPPPGSVVLASVDGAPDVLRVAAVEPERAPGATR